MRPGLHAVLLLPLLLAAAAFLLPGAQACTCMIVSTDVCLVFDRLLDRPNRLNRCVLGMVIG